MTSETANTDLHWNAMAPKTRRAFDLLASLPIPDEFYLADGTALALQIGHRISYDLDFFSSQNQLGVEISFIYQPHPLLFPSLRAPGIHLAQPTDIGLMKLAAVKDRGTRRDFVDLYCLRHIAPLPKLFELLPDKYYDRPDFSMHLAYALCYFDDAEADPHPLNMIQETDWEAVKAYCLEGSRWLSKINAGLEPPG